MSVCSYMNIYEKCVFVRVYYMCGILEFFLVQIQSPFGSKTTLSTLNGEPCVYIKNTNTLNSMLLKGHYWSLMKLQDFVDLYRQTHKHTTKNGGLDKLSNVTMQIDISFVYFRLFLLFCVKILALSQVFIVAYCVVISWADWKSTSYTRFKGHSSNSLNP